MAQMKLNEEQMRKYIESEVRNALLAENINENMTDEGVVDWLMSRFSGTNGTSLIGKFIKEHMNIPDLVNLAIGIFGVTPIVKWLCGSLGINLNSPLAGLLVTALSTYGTMKIGDRIQDARAGQAAAGGGGATDMGGGAGASGGAEGGGNR